MVEPNCPFSTSAIMNIKAFHCSLTRTSTKARSMKGSIQFITHRNALMHVTATPSKERMTWRKKWTVPPTKSMFTNFCSGLGFLLSVCCDCIARIAPTKRVHMMLIHLYKKSPKRDRLHQIAITLKLEFKAAVGDAAAGIFK